MLKHLLYSLQILGHRVPAIYLLTCDDWRSIMKLANSQKLFITRFIIVCSIMGFIAQVIQVSMQYFAYRTTTQVSFVTPRLVEPHPVAMCIRYGSLIDYKKLLNETGIRLESLDAFVDSSKDEGKLTIEQVFDYTPDANYLIAACTYRPNAWLLVNSAPKGCNERFVVKKFFTQEFICYDIQERVPKATFMESSTLSTFGKNSVYAIILNESFKEADFLTPIVFRGESPAESRDHAPLQGFFRQEPEKDKKRQFATFYLTPTDVDYKLMPKPYDTMCEDRDPNEGDVCRLKCLLHALAPYERVPGYELLTEKYKLRPMSLADTQHPVNGPIMNHIYSHCYKGCKFRPCQDGFTVTHVRQRLSSSPSISYTLTTPIDPLVDLSAQPAMFFVEFFSFVCSCFGTWFGISFLSINSLKLLKHTKKME